ncbi:hypothetical protein DSECCO2_347640 [anaerobic digester metagenome]
MSVAPIVGIVLLLNFTLVPLEGGVLMRFLVGAVLIILGLTIFLFGVDVGITPIGERLGSSLARSNKLWLLITGGLVLGFFISIAEPDLHILADQVDLVTSGTISKLSILIVVSVGIAVMLTSGLVRIVYNFPLYRLLTGVYGIIFVLAVFMSPEFLAISFDASGATTGALTVPFMLGLALGVSRLKKDSKASEKDSFGLVGIASTGAILGVMVMSLLFQVREASGEVKIGTSVSGPFYAIFLEKLPLISKEIALALVPVLLIFVFMQKVSFRMHTSAFRKILFGLVFTFIGLILFMLGVNGGFMEVGRVAGFALASLDNRFYIIGTAFVLGMVTILAEPAVYVLTHQIEEVTSGYVRRNIVMVTLAIGVALAVALSIVRILIPQVQLWHYLLPGYVLSIILSYLSPKLFVGIAFDSGGVASGPMTATFILAFAQGAAQAVPGANVMVDGFGLIAMVAMTPIVALQILGIIFKIKSKKEAVNNAS